MRSLTISLTTALVASICLAGAASAQATVSQTEVNDSFFNPCTEETVDRTYTRHLTQQNKPGPDVVIQMNWSDGKGVGQKTGNRYTMTHRIQQVGQAAEGEGNEQGMFTYRVRTSVTSQGNASNYKSETMIRMRMNADGTVTMDESDATGIECS